MKNAKPPEPACLDEIIDELTAEARSDEERICNFQRALQKHVSLPCDGFVIGEPVTLVSFNYDGNQRRGVTATCRRSDGRQYQVAGSEVLVPAHTRTVRSIWPRTAIGWGWSPICLTRKLHGSRHIPGSGRDRSHCGIR